MRNERKESFCAGRINAQGLRRFYGALISAPSPLAARASAIRSRTCGRQRLAFLAVSATGGARKPTVQGELAFRLILQAEKTEGLYRRQVIAFTPFSWLPLFIRGAVTPKGFTGVTERILVRITAALRSAYPVPHNISLLARYLGDTYPFSFVTKRKAVRR